MNKQLLTWRLWCLELNTRQFLFGIDFVSHSGNKGIGSFGINIGPFIFVRYFIEG